MKKLLSWLLAAAMLCSPALAAQRPMWYDAAVATVTERGVMTGAGSGFEPTAAATRATAVQALYNLAGKPELEPLGHLEGLGYGPSGILGTWYEDAARWAYKTGLVSGTGTGFEGDRPITRQELAALFYRYAELVDGRDVSAGTATSLDAYADAAPLLEQPSLEWAAQGLRWAVGTGVLSGKTAGAGLLLAPADTATRAELAQMLVNYMDLSAAPETDWAAALSLPDDDPAAYPSLEAYANFREVALGTIAPGVLYRSSSPIDPSQGDRRFAADELIKAAGVKTVVNTSDCRFRFKSFPGFDDTHYATLDHVALNMGHDYPSDAFLEDVRNGLDFLSETEGPYLIHGTQGIERTGYLCMMLEALMGASREEILADYMRSYADYYLLSPDTELWQGLETEAERDLAIFTAGRADLSQATEDYLLQTVGLTQTQVDLIKRHLSP